MEIKRTKEDLREALDKASSMYPYEVVVKPEAYTQYINGCQYTVSQYNNGCYDAVDYWANLVGVNKSFTNS